MRLKVNILMCYLLRFVPGNEQSLNFSFTTFELDVAPLIAELK